MKSVWKEMADRQFAEGKQNAFKIVAIDMLKDGDLDFEKIAKYSILPLAKVKELADSLA